MSFLALEVSQESLQSDLTSRFADLEAQQNVQLQFEVSSKLVIIFYKTQQIYKKINTLALKYLSYFIKHTFTKKRNILVIE